MNQEKIFNRQRYLEYEKFFFMEHEQSFVLEAGKGRVMFSAPHSVEQTRNGKIKCAEPQTGAIARLIHEELGCPVIYKTRNCGDDANYDAECAYKEALSKYIAENEILLLIDLHQLAPHRSVQVDVGTGDMRNVFEKEYLRLALQSFERCGIKNVAVDKIFNAKGRNTVSAYIARERGVTCLQLELHSNLVRFGYPESNVEGVFNALCEIAKLIV